MIAHEALQLETAFDFLLGQVLAQSLAQRVIRGRFDLRYQNRRRWLLPAPRTSALLPSSWPFC
jgi:hypothetical protein